MAKTNKTASQRVESRAVLQLFFDQLDKRIAELKREPRFDCSKCNRCGFKQRKLANAYRQKSV
jgi:hypothetical protein